ncbi:MAG: hypothetical protein RIQ62_99 [Bacteroidota bacterium]|jgi:hypothetical protein
MKQIAVPFLLAIGVLFSISSCKKKGSDGGKKDIIVVDIDRSDTTSLADSIGALAFSIPFDPPMKLDTFATKVDEYITPYGFNKGQITKVNLKSLSIVIENSPSQTFNFIKDTLVPLTIYVDSFTGTTPKPVAFLYSRPASVKTLNLTVDGTDIKDYFRSEFMQLLVGFRTQENEPVYKNTKFRVNYTFTVTADPNL